MNVLGASVSKATKSRDIIKDMETIVTANAGQNAMTDIMSARSDTLSKDIVVNVDVSRCKIGTLLPRDRGKAVGKIVVVQEHEL